MLGPSDNGRGGLHHATTDPAQVAEWWDRDPTARIGLNLGASRLCAFEFEGPRKTTPGDPAACRNAIEKAFGPDALPPTWRTISPSGGEHTLYAVPEGVTVRGCKLPGVDAPGLDNIRAGGLYVVLPAAVPAGGSDLDGRRWDTFPAAWPAPVPEWLADLTRPVEPVRRPQGEPLDPAEGDATRYGAKALAGLWSEVAHAPEGTRHATMVHATRRAYGLADAGHVTREAARMVLGHAAGVCGLPEREALSILEWVAGVAA